MINVEFLPPGNRSAVTFAQNCSMRIRSLAILLVIIQFGISCSPNDVDEDNSLKKYFDENKVNGSFCLFDNAIGKFTVYDLDRYKDSAYVPASTFKIVNALIGVETEIGS